jgi:putative redox protein
MSDQTLRSVLIERIALGRYRVTNSRGTTLTLGTGADDQFTAVELLLAAIGGCTGADVDHITAKRAEPERFEVGVTANKIRDDRGNRLVNIAVTFRVSFAQDAAGDAARAALPRAVAQSHDRLCTVSRTVELGTPIQTHIDDLD